MSPCKPHLLLMGLDLRLSTCRARRAGDLLLRAVQKELAFRYLALYTRRQEVRHFFGLDAPQYAGLTTQTMGPG